MVFQSEPLVANESTKKTKKILQNIIFYYNPDFIILLFLFNL